MFTLEFVYNDFLFAYEQFETVNAAHARALKVVELCGEAPYTGLKEIFLYNKGYQKGSLRPDLVLDSWGC